MIKEYSWDWFTYTIIALNTLTTILHSVGALVIILQQSSAPTLSPTTPNTKSTRIKNNVEILSMSTAIIATTTVSTVSVTKHSESVLIAHITFPITVALLFPFYCSMIFLTLQRYFAISLHLRYEASWIHLQRANITFASWIVGLIFLATTLSFVYTGMFANVLSWSLVGVIIFGLLATNTVFITVYIYIYIKYRRATEDTQKTLYKKKRAKIFIPFILCASFFFFGTLPHMFMPQVNDNRFSYLWFDLDCITNSLVYIFANRELHRRCPRWLRKKIGQVRNGDDEDVNNNHTTKATTETSTTSV